MLLGPNPDEKEQLWIREVREDHTDYHPEGVDDMGWLGYFVGKNSYLEALYIEFFQAISGGSYNDVIEPFIKGLNRNKSIKKLGLNSVDLLDGNIFTMLGPFFENNKVLTELTLNDCNLEEEGCRLLALALGSIKNRSLHNVSLLDNDISDEGMVDIITSLSMHPQLEEIDFTGNHLSTKGCTALGTLLQHSATKLLSLDLSSNQINDDSIEALVPALKCCSYLRTLTIDDSTSVTSRGWENLASILESPNSSLTELTFLSNNIDDEVVTALISALASNHTLRTLRIGGLILLSHGEKELSKLLCDTSSINATYRSNHTLFHLGAIPRENPLRPLLVLNDRKNEKEVAIIKILQHHNDFDMMPFFEWEFKVLPLMINWFERASAITMPINFEPNIAPRKISSIYQFIRAMPLLYVETYLMKELEDIKAAELQLEETIEKEKRKLVLLLERKRSIMQQLGQNKY